mmetsp:Transcript_12920/g.29730  ORF Transcript_12920/g.29730 Transcript_12920/m.29730 type:complete len:228 (+) Transcript_12920:2590-3273(+)
MSASQRKRGRRQHRRRRSVRKRQKWPRRSGRRRRRSRRRGAGRPRRPTRQASRRHTQGPGATGTSRLEKVLPRSSERPRTTVAAAETRARPAASTPLLSFEHRRRLRPTLRPGATRFSPSSTKWSALPSTTREWRPCGMAAQTSSIAAATSPRLLWTGVWTGGCSGSSSTGPQSTSGPLRIASRRLWSKHSPRNSTPSSRSKPRVAATRQAARWVATSTRAWPGVLR